MARYLCRPELLIPHPLYFGYAMQDDACLPQSVGQSSSYTFTCPLLVRLLSEIVEMEYGFGDILLGHIPESQLTKMKSVEKEVRASPGCVVSSTAAT